jgi:uncharacterized protein (DUF983 family)
VLNQLQPEYRLICPHCGRGNRSELTPNVNCAGCGTPIVLRQVGT